MGDKRHPLGDKRHPLGVRKKKLNSGEEDREIDRPSIERHMYVNPFTNIVGRKYKDWIRLQKGVARVLHLVEQTI